MVAKEDQGANGTPVKPASNGNDRRDPMRGEKVRGELSSMISDLNEVRMRLDSVVRRLGQTDGDGDLEGAERARLEQLRVQLSGTLDRIREKLVTRMPRTPDSL